MKAGEWFPKALSDVGQAEPVLISAMKPRIALSRERHRGYSYRSFLVWVGYLIRPGRPLVQKRIVRPAIAFITIFAMVIHFTFGCCLHRSHFDGSGCCQGNRESIADDGFCCGADHGQEHEHDEEGDDQRQDSPGGPFESCPGRDHGSLAAAAGHGCVGCTCAGMIPEVDESATGSPVRSSSVVIWKGALLDRESSRIGRFVNRLWPGETVAASSTLHSRLFERLLV